MTSKGDRLLIRNQELIPVDGILISDKTAIDYSFVTEESHY
jgi:Cu+-exporting ATPase